MATGQTKGRKKESGTGLHGRRGSDRKKIDHRWGEQTYEEIWSEGKRISNNGLIALREGKKERGTWTHSVILPGGGRQGENRGRKRTYFAHYHSPRCNVHAEKK